jgi:hypothetical protein
VEPGDWRRHRTRLCAAADEKPAAQADSRFDGLPPVAARQISQLAFQPRRSGHDGMHSKEKQAKPKQFSSGQRLT